MGALVKHVYAPAQQVTAQQVYHATIMPCYDKKLEASRKDFYDEASETTEVDCVLATSELLAMLDEQEVDFGGLAEAAEGASGGSGPGITRGEGEGMDVDEGEGAAAITTSAGGSSGGSRSCGGSTTTTSTSTSDLMLGDFAFSNLSSDGLRFMGAVDGGGGNGGSGGYCEFIFRHAARELYGVELDPATPLQFTSGRNKDLREVVLTDGDGKTVLRFAQAYGFRNIQSVITKIKRGKCPYHLVEIMACPGGCVKGGGQIKAVAKKDFKMPPVMFDSTGDLAPAVADYSGLADASAGGMAIEPAVAPSPPTQDEVAAKVSALMHDTVRREPEDNPVCQQLYRSVLGGQPFSTEARRVLHTRYHAIPKMEEVAPLGIKW
jgi:iron only hydrogenase large subunit-like protein